MRTMVLLATVVGGCSGAQIPGDGQLVIIQPEDAFYERTVFNNDNGSQILTVEALRAAVHVWDAAGAQLRLPDEVGNRFGAHFNVHWSSVELTSSDDGVCWPGLGYADIYMKNITGSQSLTTTVAHELGHAMGLSHITDDGIMNPADSELRLTAADLVEFNRAVKRSSDPLQKY